MLTGMEWWDGLWEWLTTHADGVAALAAPLSVLFTGLAGWAAIVTVIRSRRRERCNMRLDFVPMLAADGEKVMPRVVVRVLLHNDGPATPLWIKYRRYRVGGSGGDTIGGIAPAEVAELWNSPPEKWLTRQNIAITWLEPDGRKRHIHCSYQLQGEWTAPANRRSSPAGRDWYPSKATRPARLQRRRLLLPRKLASYLQTLRRGSDAPEA